MTKDAIETLGTDPLEYRCPWCYQVHTVEDWDGSDVVVAKCCDVSEEEEAFKETSTVRLRVKVA